MCLRGFFFVQEVTSNIFLQSCVDFLAKNHATSDGRVQAPVAIVCLDEKLSKVRNFLRLDDFAGLKILRLRWDLVMMVGDMFWTIDSSSDSSMSL